MKLNEIEWPGSPLVPASPDPVLQREVKQAFGMIPSWAVYLAPVPWLVRAQIVMYGRPLRHLPHDIIDLVDLVVSMDNSCRYCYGVTRSLLELLGHREESIRKLEEDLSQAELSERDKVALQLARKISRADPRADRSDLDKMEKMGVSRVWIAELIFEASVACFANRISTLVALPPARLEAISRNWFVHALRPLSFRYVRFRLHRRNRTEDVPFENNGPGARIVSLLKGSPSAGALRTILDWAWESEITSKRLKALIFGVVGRSAGCRLCESDATELLQEHGFPPEEIANLFEHLNCNGLSQFESRAIHFARQTVHYQVGTIQQECRELLAHMPAEAALEICGLASLANTLTRLSVLRNWNGESCGS